MEFNNPKAATAGQKRKAGEEPEDESTTEEESDEQHKAQPESGSLGSGDDFELTPLPQRESPTVKFGKLIKEEITRLRIQQKKDLGHAPDAPQLTGAVEVAAYLMYLLKRLHTWDPKHPMFGDFEEGKIRAPFNSYRRNGASWMNYLNSLARWTFKNTVRLGFNNCWMSKNTGQLKLLKGGTLCKSVLVTRLLAFLMHPSSDRWAMLNDPKLHFDHLCQRGGERPDQGGYKCLNGIEHGLLSDRDGNEDRKKCTNGALALCPGHGQSRSKCIFTHPDGTLQPCRNIKTHVPECKHSPKCFPPPSSAT